MGEPTHRIMLNGRAHILMMPEACPGETPLHLRFTEDTCPVCRAERAEARVKELEEIALWLWNNLGHGEKQHIPSWIGGPIRDIRERALREEGR